jgi:hypothetical protein
MASVARRADEAQQSAAMAGSGSEAAKSDLYFMAKLRMFEVVAGPGIEPGHKDFQVFS